MEAEDIILSALSAQAGALNLSSLTGSWDEAKDEPRILFRRADIAIDVSRSPDINRLTRDLQTELGDVATVQGLDDRVFIYFSDETPKESVMRIIDAAMRFLGDRVGNVGFVNSYDWL
jgi:hypothetical protein